MSRFDSIGFLWEDIPVESKGRGKRTYTVQPIPESDWRPPKEFPNLSGAKVIGLDTETKDEHLIESGPGWARNDGHIVGVSLATEDGHSWYFPMRHEMQKEYNLDPENVLAYLKDTLGTNIPKVGANIGYDIGWLRQEGVDVKGLAYDVQFAEALLDDTSNDYSLEAISDKYLGTGKVTEKLYEWCSKSYGGNANGKQRANIYRSPVTMVGPYAEGDADLPIKIFKKQWAELEKADLIDTFMLETKLIPFLIGMRFRGTPVDIERAENNLLFLDEEILTSQKSLNDIGGFTVNVYAGADLQRLFDKVGLSYPYTAKGNPSFTQDFLNTVSHPVGQLVNIIRKLTKTKTAFIQNAIIDKQVNGIVYPSFHPLRGESGGAVSGRYSSSAPNFQQVPARDPKLGPLMRRMFIPEAGKQWLKADYSQIEYRMFANDSQDDQLIERYSQSGTDFHEIVSGFLNHKLPRKIVKNFNFMSLYGGGVEKTVSMVKSNLKESEIEEIHSSFELPDSHDKGRALGIHFMELYASQFPSAKGTLKRYMDMAMKSGEVRTILGRRSSFNLWEPIGNNKKFSKALPFAMAIQKYGTRIQRAGAYRALNRRLQGSAADLLKKGLLLCMEEGLFNEDRLGFPHLLVHDELDMSVSQDNFKDLKLLKEIMENAIPLKVPVVIDMEIGKNWNDITDLNL